MNKKQLITGAEEIDAYGGGNKLVAGASSGVEGIALGEKIGF